MTRQRMTRERAWIAFGFLCMAWLAAAVMTVGNMVAALDDPDSWRGFVILLAVLLAVTGLMVLHLKTMPPRAR